MRIKRRRKKGGAKRPVVGRNCVFLSYDGPVAVCGLRPGETCSKSGTCGYEEKSRTIDRLKDAIGR